MLSLLAALALAVHGEELLEVHSPRPLQAEGAAEALEPWETPIAGFFVRSHHGVPALDRSSWTLEIDGLVERKVRLGFEDLRRLGSASRHAVLQCSGNGRGRQEPPVPGIQWLKGALGNAEWKGASLADVLALAGPKPEARFARVEGADLPAAASVPAFVRSLPLERLPREAMLAWEMNRVPLPPEHGGPVRLVIPGWYGQNWMKWVTRITLEKEEDPGFYMKKGYRMPKEQVRPGLAWDSSTGSPIERLRVQSIIVRPQPGETLASDEAEVLGKAFSGAASVTKVELSFDRGASWSPAELEPPRAGGGWQGFRSALKLPTGPAEVWSRATDSEGNVQPLEPDWNPAGYLYNAVDRVRFAAGAEPVAAGASVARARCLTCHAPEMLESQRLSRKQWEGVVSKMHGFGAKLAAGEREALLAYLEGLSPSRSAAKPRRAAYARLASGSARPEGDARLGGRLYAQSCASCHGGDAAGETGPRLAGRRYDEAEFRGVVVEGRGEMPGFDSLGAADLAALRAYLSEP